MSNQLVLCVGDPHARISTIGDLAKLSLKIKELAKEKKVTHIVILGDLFNDFTKIHLLVLRAVVNFFEIVLSTHLPVYYIVGNHDMLNNQVFLEDFHALTPFKNWLNNLKIVDEPLVEDGFVFCPYVAPGRFKEAVGPILKTKPLVWPGAIFCHQEFFGAKMGAIESKVGDVWSDKLPLVVSGHVHDREWLQPNILYVGAPAAQAYGENDDKTVSILEFQDSKFISEELFDLGMPKRITVTISVEEAKVYVFPENTYVRMNIIGTLEELTAFKKTARYDELFKKAKVVPKPSDKVYVKASVRGVSYMQLLKQACENESQAVKSAYHELTQSEVQGAN